MLKRSGGLHRLERSYHDRIAVIPMDFDVKLDAMGMMCPMPIVELSKKVKKRPERAQPRAKDPSKKDGYADKGAN